MSGNISLVLYMKLFVVVELSSVPCPSSMNIFRIQVLTVSQKIWMS